jgi:hypothetical protein
MFFSLNQNNFAVLIRVPASACHFICSAYGTRFTGGGVHVPSRIDGADFFG